jgi:hypothetical protein
VTLPDSAVNWARTDEDSASTRYQWYAKTRAEEDFERLSDEVASVLGAIVASADRTRALELAQQVRSTLADWPRTHYGYRQQDVREILGVLDEAIASLRAETAPNAFDLALVAAAPDIRVTPLAATPSKREQIHQVWQLAAVSDRAPERVALLQTVLALLEDVGPALTTREVSGLRRLANARIQREERIDAQYAALARRVLSDAQRAAQRANIAEVEKIANRIARDDARLGSSRPEIVQALRMSVQGELETARRLRLLQDRWAIRQRVYNQYRQVVGTELLLLVKAEPALEAIRRLDGPPPDTLADLLRQLRGGADRLARLAPPDELRGVHELLTSAWRFAENAVSGRYDAARGANVSAAWQASSSAAGSLLLLSRARQELREFIEPPTLQ